MAITYNARDEDTRNVGNIFSQMAVDIEICPQAQGYLALTSKKIFLTTPDIVLKSKDGEVIYGCGTKAGSDSTPERAIADLGQVFFNTARNDQCLAVAVGGEGPRTQYKMYKSDGAAGVIDMGEFMTERKAGQGEHVVQAAVTFRR